MNDFVVASTLYFVICTIVVLFATPSKVGKVALTATFGLTYTLIFMIHTQSN